MLLAGLLLAALAIPYVLSDPRIQQAAKRAAKPATEVGAAAGSSAGPANSPQGATSPAADAGVRSLPLEELFRFDRTPQWVTATWPAVSTVAGDPEQLGMRVALVSGTQPDDIAGSLTYYFDDHHQLQRITFSGLTADPRRLLAVTATRTGLKSVPTTGFARYIAGDEKQPTSRVVVQHLPMVRATAAARMEVAVDLKRADVAGWEKRAAEQPEPSLLPASYRRW
jgi:hypothetical protein